ncbi:MAG: NAD-dependent epimerase/dehydratase family protein, partial [Eubacteriales bacterium]|nr:NAD-dependent epimerase/dehydratase family protein [Eubacteriales bacterium]
MKNVLIFGEGSYIGNAVYSWLQNKGGYNVTIMSSRGKYVSEIDLSPYQVVYYVAGIAHQKETKDNAHLYYEVNRDLACAVAKRAKQDGVGQFILMSTLSVYGLNEGIIRKDTKEKPTTYYGKSKMQADRKIQKLADNEFHVAIIRSPMVYGAGGCKGNYQRLRSLALKTPVFPEIKNRRSMIYIDNLCDFIERVIREDITGIRIPQNKDYVCTSEMV